MEEKKQIEEEKEQEDSNSCLTPRRKVILKHVLIAGLWVLVFEGIGAGLGAGFRAGTWYADLNKSPFHHQTGCLHQYGPSFSLYWQYSAGC